jgi:hypothetical protein
MRITYFGFGPTEIRALLFFGNLSTLAFGVVYLQPRLTGLAAFGPLSGHDVVISVLSVLGVGAIATLAVRAARALAVLDPPRAAPPGSAE